MLELIISLFCGNLLKLGSANMLKKMHGKKSVKIVLIVVLIWCIFFVTDFIRATNTQHPIFAVPLFILRDGGSREYFGLGYKVITYVDRHPETGEIRYGEVGRVEIGTWFMPFRN